MRQSLRPECLADCQPPVLEGKDSPGIGCIVIPIVYDVYQASAPRILPGTAQKAREYIVSTETPTLAAKRTGSHTPTTMPISVNRLCQDMEKAPRVTSSGLSPMRIIYLFLVGVSPPAFKVVHLRRRRTKRATGRRPTSVKSPKP